MILTIQNTVYNFNHRNMIYIHQLCLDLQLKSKINSNVEREIEIGKLVNHY